MVHTPRHTTLASLGEEALAAGVAPAQRKRHGVYYSPAALVEEVLNRAAEFVPRGARLTVVDPACGAGAFLAAAQSRWPKATLLGLELDAGAAAVCTRRVPGATVTVGNALVGDALERLLARAPRPSFQLWVGNPPYNGTSPLLEDEAAYRRVRALLPAQHPLPRGTSLRDDYAFFLLRASECLAERTGALAFITSATLLDAFLYAPLRRALCERLALREVVPLPDGAFQGTRVKTCATVWTSPGPTTGAVKLGERRFVPGGDDFALRPPEARAAALDAKWSGEGEPLTTLIPVSLPGLKTRFDELLVDDDAEVLLERVDAFLRAKVRSLPAFARAHGLAADLLPKLERLKATQQPGAAASSAQVRPFLRYRGARGFGPTAFCYLDRELIPRGDHRLRGGYDPHASFPKLVFNLRELPLHAAVAEEAGCVTAYRHARFAPLYVPRCALAGGLSAAAANPTDALALNFSPRGLAWAQRFSSPVAALRAIAAFIHSDAVQKVWAPEFGTRRVLPVPLLAGQT